MKTLLAVVGTYNYIDVDTSVNIDSYNCSLPYDIICLLVTSLTKSQKLILNSLIGYANHHAKITPAIETLASLIGCHENTARAAIQRLADLQLIKFTPRRRMTHIYDIADEFNDAELRNLLSDILPALIYMPHRGMNFSPRKLYPNNKNIKYIRESAVGFHDIRRDVQWLSLEEVARKKEIVMFEARQDHSSPTTIIPDYIKNIQEITMSHDQRLQLVGYDRVTVDYARKAMLRKIEKDGMPQAPFPFFKKICEVSHGKGTTIGSGSYPPKHSSKQTTNNQSRIDSTNQLFQRYAEQRELAKASWRKPLNELGAMKAEGLARVKDPGLRMVLGQLFDQCVRSSMKEESDNPSTEISEPQEQFFHIPEPIQQDIFIGEDDSGYEAINTHALFDDA